MRDDGPAIDLAVTAFALVAVLWLAPRLQRTNFVSGGANDHRMASSPLCSSSK